MVIFFSDLECVFIYNFRGSIFLDHLEGEKEDQAVSSMKFLITLEILFNSMFETVFEILYNLSLGV